MDRTLAIKTYPVGGRAMYRRTRRWGREVWVLPCTIVGVGSKRFRIRIDWGPGQGEELWVSPESLASWTAEAERIAKGTKGRE